MKNVKGNNKLFSPVESKVINMTHILEESHVLKVCMLWYFPSRVFFTKNDTPTEKGKNVGKNQLTSFVIATHSSSFL